MSSRRQENSSDDPFSCYNATKRATSSDPFADYNARKSTVCDGDISRFNVIRASPSKEKHYREGSTRSAPPVHYREAHDRKRPYERRSDDHRNRGDDNMDRSDDNRGRRDDNRGLRDDYRGRRDGHRGRGDRQRSIDDDGRTFRNQSGQSGDIVDQYRRIPAFLQQGSAVQPPPPAPQPLPPASYASSPAPPPPPGYAPAPHMEYLVPPPYLPPPLSNGVREGPLHRPPPPPQHPYWEGEARRPPPHGAPHYPPAPPPPPAAPRHPGHPPPAAPPYPPAPGYHQPAPHYPPPGRHPPPAHHPTYPRPRAPSYHHPHHPQDPHPPPPPPRQSPVKPPPNISEIAKIMTCFKENAQKDLEGAKGMITTLLPPQPTVTTPTDPSDTSHPRLGDSSYSSSPITYTKPAAPPKPPVRRGPDFTSMFARQAEKYKSNWVDTAPSSSKEEEEDRGNVINLSSSLEVDLNEVTESQANLLAKYLVTRERGLRTITDFVPTREKKISTNEDESSVLETNQSIRKKFTERPDPIPGTVSCEICKRYNLPVVEYRKHISTDFHGWMDGTFQTAFPRDHSVTRFSLIWCTMCAGFFMTTYEGMTVLGHETSEGHAKYRSICMLKYGRNYPTMKFVYMEELRTTKVKIPPPHKCKYVVPREALNAYKAAYSKLCERNLVS